MLIAGCRSPASTPSVDTWFKTYGGYRYDMAEDVLPADDGGYYLFGTTNMEFGPVLDGDIYVIKTDAAGNRVWDRSTRRKVTNGA